MKISNSIFINHYCPINSEKESPLHLSHCTFISCRSENFPGAIRWISKGEDVFIDNIAAESCSSESSSDFAYLEEKTVSISLISISCCKKGSHVLDIGDNSLVLNMNMSHCKANFESLVFREDQAEVRLSRFYSCYAETYVVIGYVSTINRGSYVDMTNCTSASAKTLGVLRAESEIFLYRSNFINNTGYVMFASSSSVRFNLLNCYIKGLKNSSGILKTSSDDSWDSRENDIPIVKAEGYIRESCKRLLKVPISTMRFISSTVSGKKC